MDKRIKKYLILAFIASTMVTASGPATAIEKGDWLVRVGVGHVSPNDGSSGVVAKDAIGVGSDTQLVAEGTYMLTDNVGLELLVSTPWTHDITLKGTGKIGETKQLPPTLSVQYHFIPKGKVRPYVGVGLNYTIFFDEKSTAVISSLDLDNSLGFAAQGGIDVDINKKWFLNANVRYVSIDTTATTNLGNIKVDIDPWIYSVGVGFRF